MKTDAVVRAIAERSGLRRTAAAQENLGSLARIELPARCVVDLDRTFYTQRAARPYANTGLHGRVLVRSFVSCRAHDAQ